MDLSFGHVLFCQFFNGNSVILLQHTICDHIPKEMRTVKGNLLARLKAFEGVLTFLSLVFEGLLCCVDGYTKNKGSYFDFGLPFCTGARAYIIAEKKLVCLDNLTVPTFT